MKPSGPRIEVLINLYQINLNTPSMVIFNSTIRIESTSVDWYNNLTY